LATHLPGLFYLVALNSIAGDDPPLDGAVLQVLLYNAISFSVPVAAFVLADRHAVGTQARITELSRLGAPPPAGPPGGGVRGRRHVPPGEGHEGSSRARRFACGPSPSARGQQTALPRWRPGLAR
jgi:hypothetical protein